MRIGLAYNEKPDLDSSLDDPSSSGSDAFVEWDDRSTIEAVEQALSLFGDVVRLEAHVPAMCEFLDIPCSASDSLTLALALHKTRTKQILTQRGVATAPFAEVASLEDVRRVALPFPLFVKPVHEG